MGLIKESRQLPLFRCSPWGPSTSNKIDSHISGALKQMISKLEGGFRIGFYFLGIGFEGNLFLTCGDSVFNLWESVFKLLGICF